MILTYIMFAVALSLSAVAAYYSIVGLAAIFSAATIPIIIMGSMLEAAKLTTTLWLHEYWSRSRWIMKLYLVPAVVALMFLTSMGIFGFLSKAHLDQAVPTGDVAAQVSLIDEKIRIQREYIQTERDNIAAARNTLSQLDAQVNERLSRGTTENSAERSVQIRGQQRTERRAVQRDIDESQKRIEAINAEIARLNEQRAPIAADLRKVEAEVGPIKYIAALIYGDNPDSNLLERAVRWVTILLVAVFDPLAIMMLLAATESLKWHRQSRMAPVPETVVAEPEPEPAPEPEVAPLEPDRPTVPAVFYINDDLIRPLADPPAESAAQTEPESQTARPAVVEAVPTDHTRDVEDDEDAMGTHPVIKQVKALWKADHPKATLKEQRRLVEEGKIAGLPWMEYLDDPRIRRDVTFGNYFPTQALKGDMFLATNGMPTQLFKFNGDRWIQVDKNQTDSYTYNPAYIDFLIERLSSGQYDPDLLTESEKSKIEAKLRPEGK